MRNGRKTDKFDDLRKRAEAKLSEIPFEGLSQEEMQKVVHELRVHQIELEMQNDALREAQAELVESRSKYTDLYDFAPVGYLTVDKDSRILEANLTLSRLMGIERGRFLGQPFSSYIALKDRTNFLNFIAGIFETRERGSLETNLDLVRSGKRFSALLEAVFVEDPKGKGQCRISVTDISERKKAEEATLFYMSKLEQSNKELQEFAFVASHDLQEPLRKVQAFGNLLVEHHGDALDEQGKDYLRRMINAANRMSGMITSLLTYSRVATRAEKFQRVDLNRVVEEVLDDLALAIEKSGARVEVGELCEIEADRIQMAQLLQNLIGNAIKFHGPDPPLIRVRTEVDGGAGVAGKGQCSIYVEDNGIGFDAKYINRIFTLFQRLHGRSEYEGAGMGLAISRKIVERHGGSITAISKPGEGSTFIITLPLEQPGGVWSGLALAHPCMIPVHHQSTFQETVII